MEIVSKKQKKVGRPTKAVKKEVRACVRFTRQEYNIVQEKATQAGVKVSEFIRLIAIRAEVKPRLTPEEIHAVRQLIGMSVNMNQVAKISHREGLFEAMRYFEGYRNLIDDLLKNLKS